MSDVFINKIYIEKAKSELQYHSSYFLYSDGTLYHLLCERLSDVMVGFGSLMSKKNDSPERPMFKEMDKPSIRAKDLLEEMILIDVGKIRLLKSDIIGLEPRLCERSTYRARIELRGKEAYTVDLHGVSDIINSERKSLVRILQIITKQIINNT